MIVHDGSMLIRDEIKIKARESIRKIEAETQAKIEEMKNETELKLKKIREDILEQAKKRAIAESRKIRAQTNVEIKRMILDGREQPISEAFEEATKKIESTDPNALKKELSAFIRRGIGECRGDMIKVIANERTAKMFDARTLNAIKKESGRKVTLDVDVRNVEPGIVVHDPENNMYLDYSFLSIFKKNEDKIRAEVHRIFFSPAEQVVR